MNFPYEKLQDILGYTFDDERLLKEAFTHSTYANAYGGKDNERLEYLGDAVLQLVVTEWQYRADGSASEGELTRERQQLVCEDALYKAVLKLKIKEYLLICGSHANVGKKTISSLFETVVGAIYLDGGYDEAKRFILKHGVLELQRNTDNPKGVLQEFLQGIGMPTPQYECKKEGLDNAPVFYCTVTAMGKTAQGKGGSKKQAEQNAAAALMEMLTKEKRKK